MRSPLKGFQVTSGIVYLQSILERSQDLKINNHEQDWTNNHKPQKMLQPLLEDEMLLEIVNCGSHQIEKF